MAEDIQQGGSGAAGGSGAGDGGQAGGQGSQGAGSGDQGQQGAKGGGSGGDGQPSFSVPDAYKDKGWAKKVQSQEDLYKLVDNLDGLVGKKSVVPDLSDLTKPEAQEFLKTLKGNTKIEDYKFPEGADAEFSKQVAGLFDAAGIPAPLANKIISEYSGIAEKIQAQQVSKEGLEAEWKKSFGDDYTEAAGKATNLIKENLSAEDRQLFEGIPNQYLGLVYRLADSFRKKYGASESGRAGEGGGGKPGGDINAIRSSLKAKLKELSGKQFIDSDEYQRVLDQLYNTYKQ